jgi:glycerol-3-phosphate dehydrogenase
MAAEPLEEVLLAGQVEFVGENGPIVVGGVAPLAEARARVVINATGAWADTLRAQVGKIPRLRPLRGSHLVVPYKRLPLTRAVTFLHPRDGRPVFAIPWEGVTIFGTTDVDHKSSLQSDPSISGDEFEYLLQALQHVFPGQELVPQDVMTTFSGLRPVVNTGKADPSKESREHVIWEEAGLLTVSGGKLTTFRLMARDALKAARQQIGELRFEQEIPLLDVPPPGVEALLAKSDISPTHRLRLLGRYGGRAAQIVDTENPADLEFIPETPYLWAELRHAARTEGVIHLDDLLLRRIRLGILCPNGGLDLIDRIQAIAQPELGWDEPRWQAEVEAYTRLWRESYYFN